MSKPDAASVRDFFQAIKAGDVARVEDLLNAAPKLARAYDADCFGATALIHAVALGDRGMIDLLVSRGADPDTPSDWWAGGFRPIDDADEATVDYLLSRGATLTPHAAARLGRVKELAAMLDAVPALVSQRGGDGQLPLHFARDIETAALLLDRGAEIDMKDIDHASTAAQWCASSRPTVVGYLVSRGAAADLFMACMIDDAALAAKLVDAEPDGVNARISRERFPAPGSEALGIYHYTVGTNCTPLHAAAAVGATRACRWLLELGADPNATGGYDDATPLHQAAWQNRPESARVLLDHRAAIDMRSGSLHRNTPLGWAIVAGSFEVVEFLIQRGAKLDAALRSDAAAGARGQFRAFKRKVPIEAWHRIDRLVGSVPQQ